MQVSLKVAMFIGTVRNNHDSVKNTWKELEFDLGGEDGAVKIWSRSGMLRSILFENGCPVYAICWKGDDTSIAFCCGENCFTKILKSQVIREFLNFCLEIIASISLFSIRAFIGWKIFLPIMFRIKQQTSHCQRLRDLHFKTCHSELFSLLFSNSRQSLMDYKIQLVLLKSCAEAKAFECLQNKFVH